MAGRASRTWRRTASVGLMGISFAGGLSVVAAGAPRCATRSPTCSRLAATAISRACCATCARASSRCRPMHRPGTPPHFRAPHDYGVAVILLGLADRIVPPDQVAPLRHGIETFLTASQLTLVDMNQATATFKKSQAIAATLPEPSAHADAVRQRSQHQGAGRRAAAGARSHRRRGVPAGALGRAIAAAAGAGLSAARHRRHSDPGRRDASAGAVVARAWDTSCIRC